MRHAVVHRVALSTCALLVAAAALFAWRARVPRPGRQPEERGAVLEVFEDHCAGCHEAAVLARPLRETADRDAAAAALLEFLAEHGDAGTVEDRAIVDFLLAQSR